jgi:DNA-binding winged helix-turn-helix (wHTH) protein
MIEFPPFRLDPVNQCLWRRRDNGDERVPLAPKTFAVLRYLAEQAGRLVTEEELLTVVWPKAYVQPEAIKSQLHEIRKILGDSPKTPLYIETLPGAATGSSQRLAQLTRRI